jgi:hypothetical protein
VSSPMTPSLKPSKRTYQSLSDDESTDNVAIKEEESVWPDEDIVLIHVNEGKERKKKSKSGIDFVEIQGRGMFRCGEGDCQFASKQAHHVKNHKAFIHDIGVTYYYCDEIGCEYKAKVASNVKSHKAAIHDIDVTYYYCDEIGCGYKAKVSSNVQRQR